MNIDPFLSSTTTGSPLVLGRDLWHDVAVPRFLTLADVAETLNISASQTYALVRSGDLPAIKVGGRGQWRVEASELENYIARMYAHTKEQIASGALPAEKSTSL